MTEPVVDIQKRRERNKNILAHVYNLPSIPVIMMEVNKLLDNPMTSASELGKVISKDQGLVTKILTVANSPLYGLPRRVSTIDFAIVILGFDHIKNIVLALSMIEAFKSKSDKYLDRRKYWAHSIMVASTAKRICDDLGYHFTGEAFTSGLLHDLGIPVIHKFFNTEFLKICELAETPEFTLNTAETEVLGLTHQDIGYFLAQRWNLPLNLADTILNHECPEQSSQNKSLASVIHLADYMTSRLGVGDFNWDKNYQLDLSIIKTLNLGDEQYLEKFVQSYKAPLLTQIDSLKI